MYGLIFRSDLYNNEEKVFIPMKKDHALKELEKDFNNDEIVRALYLVPKEEK